MEMFLSGNQCIAQGVKLSRVEVISAYPITPATPVRKSFMRWWQPASWMLIL